MKTERGRVLLAMSGGVDSSVAAAVLKAQGHEVIGATMRVYDHGPHSRCGSCCSPEDIGDARRVADLLGITHYTFNYEEKFRAEVMLPFAREYLAGRTPNPCVLCNDRMKFHWMLRRMAQLDCRILATGHYARIAGAPGDRRLLRARDRSKDQSYFLFSLRQEQMDRVVFPLGDMTKDQVRAMARSFGLPVADKPDSQEICFAPDGDYARVVEEMMTGVRRDGEIVDTAGRVLGRHQGCHRFTVGQRKGLGSLGPTPRYVLRVEADRGRIVVGSADELFFSGLVCRRFHWISGRAPQNHVSGSLRVRYRHPGVGARAYPQGEGVSFVFDEPVRAVAPGQAAVFYRGEEVLGGGWIDETHSREEAHSASLTAPGQGAQGAVADTLEKGSMS